MKVHKDHVEGKDSGIPMQSCVGGEVIGDNQVEGLDHWI